MDTALQTAPAEAPESGILPAAPDGRLHPLVGHLRAAYEVLLLARREAKNLGLTRSYTEINFSLDHLEGAFPEKMPNA